MKIEIDPFRTVLILATGLAITMTCIRCAEAGEAALTWTAPTQRCDGTPLTNLAGYGLAWGQQRVDLPLQLAHTVTGLAPGTWWFSLAAIDADGKRSEFVTVEKTVAPSEFVTAGGPVFNIVKRVDRFLLVSVGTVPPGVQCIAGHSVNGNYAVPRASVTWSGSVRPDIVVAQCQ